MIGALAILLSTGFIIMIIMLIIVADVIVNDLLLGGHAQWWLGGIAAVVAIFGLIMASTSWYANQSNMEIKKERET